MADALQNPKRRSWVVVYGVGFLVWAGALSSIGGLVLGVRKFCRPWEVEYYGDVVFFGAVFVGLNLLSLFGLLPLQMHWLGGRWAFRRKLIFWSSLLAIVLMIGMGWFWAISRIGTADRLWEMGFYEAAHGVYSNAHWHGRLSREELERYYVRDVSYYVYKGDLTAAAYVKRHAERIFQPLNLPPDVDSILRQQAPLDRPENSKDGRPR